VRVPLQKLEAESKLASERVASEDKGRREEKATAEAEALRAEVKKLKAEGDERANE
jgi:hypothetical protein